MGYPILVARIASMLAARTAVAGGEEAVAGITESLESGPTKGSIMLPVSSEPIAAIGFNGETEEILVVFKRGGQRVYSYPGSMEQFTEFALAPSKGQYFNANFK